MQLFAMKLQMFVSWSTTIIIRLQAKICNGISQTRMIDHRWYLSSHNLINNYVMTRYHDW